MISGGIVAVFSGLSKIGSDSGVFPSELPRQFRGLLPLHSPPRAPEPGDWRFEHEEPGQSFREFRAGFREFRAGFREFRAGFLEDKAAVPRLSSAPDKFLVVFPLGEFDPDRRRIVELTAEFLSLYFGLPVKLEEPLPLSLIPPKALRAGPDGNQQILTRFVLQDLLPPRFPKGAIAVIALSSADLWPGEGWNFVFGQASLTERVGVWSIARFGDPQGGADAFRVGLLRAMKVATHEAGHMFSMLHCTAYRCNMGGSNSLFETDRQPLALCPECLAKVCWGLEIDPVERFEGLLAFCREHGFEGQEDFYRRSLAAVRESRE